jgi:F-type H+-transporting ATPase subunit delta
MLASLIAERYAKALLRAAQAEKALGDVGAQAQGLSQALQGAEGAQRFLGDPIAEPAAKLAVMAAAFEGGPHAVLRSFLEAVLAQKRERFLPLILKAFLQLRDEAEGRSEASLGTARPLDAGEVALLEGELSRRLGRQVTLKPYTEKELLGGAVLRLGDTVYDASLRSRLKRLGQLLSEGPPPRPKRARSTPAKGAAQKKPGAKKRAAKPTGKAAKPSKPAKKKVTAVKANSKAKAKPAAKPKAAVKAKAAKAVKVKPSTAGQALAAKLLKKPL